MSIKPIETHKWNNAGLIKFLIIEGLVIACIYIVVNIIYSYWVELIILPVGYIVLSGLILIIMNFSVKYKFYESYILNHNKEQFRYDNIKHIYIVKRKFGRMILKAPSIFFEFKDNQVMYNMMIPKDIDAFINSLKEYCPEVEVTNTDRMVWVKETGVEWVE